MRGHLEKRYDSSYTIVIEAGRDPATSKRKRIVQAFQGNKRDAEKEMVRLIREVEQGTYVEPSQLTLGAYLERWLFDYGKANLAPSTYVSYERIIRKHLIPALGMVYLSKLQPMHVQNYYSKALEQGRRDGKGGLSLRTVQYHHRVLREALQHAVKWQIIARNVADAVEPPRPGKEEIQTLDADGVRKLLDTVKGHEDEALIITALYTGMRLGEVLGLRWQDVNLDDRKIMIRQALQRLPRQGFIFREPKTKKGRRQIAISPTIVNVLRKLRKQQAENRLRFGDQYDDQGLVFCHHDGRAFDPSVVSHRLRRLAIQAGFPGFRFHDLRHTHATLLLTQGVHPKIVQERLGHETINITLDVYSHVLPGLQEAAADRFDKVLNGEFGHRSGTGRGKKS